MASTVTACPASPATNSRWPAEAIGDLLVPLAGGVLLGLPFYSQQFCWVAWIALVPTAWVLSKPRATPWLYVGAFYGSLAFNLLGLDWIRASDRGIMVDSWIIFAHLLAVFGLGVVWIGRRVMHATALPALIVLPTFWVSVEWARWHIAGFIVDDGFPFLRLGATQAGQGRLIQIADLGGIAAVSWLVAAGNGAVFDVVDAMFGVRSPGRSIVRGGASLGAAAAIILAAWVYGAWQLSKPLGELGPSLGIVSGPFDLTPGAATGSLRHDIMAGLESNRMAAIDPRATPTYPDLLVWKEGAVSGSLFLSRGTPSSARMSGRCQDAGPSGKTTSNFARRLEELQLVAQQLRCSLIIGCKRRERGDSEDVAYNSVVFVDHDKGDFAYYDKKHLAPLLESRPQLVYTLGLSPPYWSRKPREPRFHRGSQQCCFELATESRTYRLATSICYDLFFPDEHRTMVESAADGAGLDFFVGATNERRAQGSTFPEFSLAMQRFRAIECRRAYVRNAEFGNSAIVDSRGRFVPTIRAEAANERTILIGRVPISGGCTLYAVWGEWLPMVACAFIGLVLIVSLGSRTRVRNAQSAECRSMHRP